MRNPNAVLIDFCDNCGDPVYFDTWEKKIMFTCEGSCGTIDPNTLPEWVRDEVE